MMPSSAAPTPTPARALRATEKGATDKGSAEGAPSGPVTDEAIRALGGAIHAELRESLAPEDVVRLATDLLGRVTAELQAARHDKA